ncbi:hypothetical protein CYMTET_19376, partial [Cymbomonas tetramitiformis]
VRLLLKPGSGCTLLEIRQLWQYGSRPAVKACPALRPRSAELVRRSARPRPCPARLQRLHLAAKAARAGLMDALASEAVSLAAPTCLAALHTAASQISDPKATTVLELSPVQVAEGGAAVLGALAEGLSGDEAQRLLLPTLQGLLGGHGPHAVKRGQTANGGALRAALLAVPVVRSLWRVLGPGVFLTHVHPLVIASLRKGTPDEVSSAAAALLESAARVQPLPVTLRRTVRPLLAVLGEGAAVVRPFLEVARGIGEAAIARHIIPALTAVLAAADPPSSTASATPGGGSGAGGAGWSTVMVASGERVGPVAARLLGCVEVLEGLLPMLPPAVIETDVLPRPSAPPSPLLSLLLQPYPCLPLLKRAAQCLLAAADHLGPGSVVECLLPHLRIFFQACEQVELDPEMFKHRKNLERELDQPNEPRFMGEQEASSDPAKKEVHIELLRILYPTFAQVVGITSLRAAVSNWHLLEHKLYAFCGWVPAGGEATEATQIRGSRGQPAPDGIAQAGSSVHERVETERAAMLLDGIIPMWIPGVRPAPDSRPGECSTPIFGKSKLDSIARSCSALMTRACS